MIVPEFRLLPYTLPLIVILFLILSTSADTRSITYSIDGSLNSTFHSAYNSEKTSEATGSFVWDSRLNSSLSIKLSRDILLSNILNLGYGQVNIKPGSSNIWSEPMINSDFINFTTSLRSDDREKYFGFLRLNFKSSFFDQIGKTSLNPFILSGAAGATLTFKRDNLNISLAASAGMMYKNVRRISDLIYDNTDTKNVITDQYYNENVKLDLDLNYTLSQHLYLNSQCQISQPFACINDRQKQCWRPPELSWSLTLNAPVTSYLNFCYSADLKVFHSVKTTLRFNHSLNAGLYFNFKSK
ncbi:MAG TPA: hypothetical protein VHO70_11415 [Chitinispirillaceae bacterium]|nr:hypothetical protein [Chitinispirillaceae bacterium]